MVDLQRVYGSDEAKVVVYSHRLHIAEEENKKWHVAAEKAVERYENIHTRMQETLGGHQVNVPLGISIIDSLYSSLTAADIATTVTPKGGGTEDQAYVAQSALVEEWDVAKVNTRGNKATKDTLLTGIGAAKVGYEYREMVQKVPRTDDAIDHEILQMFQQAHEAGENAPSPEDIEANVPLVEDQTFILRDTVVVDYVPWNMLLWDHSAKNWADLRWVAQKTYCSVDEVKENPLFQEYCKGTRSGAKLKGLKADTTIDPSVLKPGDKATDPDDERVTIYEYHDLETGNVCTFAKDQDFLLNETPSPFALNPDPEDRNAFVPLILRETPSRVRGISEMEVLDATLKEMDIYRSNLATYFERMSPKFVAPEGMITETGKTALRSQEYGAVIEYDRSFNKDDITPLTPPALMAEMYGMTDKLEVEAREATGVNELMRGLFPASKQTATTTAEVVSASAARQAEKRTKLEDFYQAIARRMLQLMQMFYDHERITKLVDDAGAVDWTWSAEDIVGAYSLEVALTPKEPKSWQTRRDNSYAMLNILGPLAQAPAPEGGTIVNMRGLLRLVLSEQGWPRRVISQVLNLPEDQQKQALAQLQMQAGQASAAQGLARPDLVPGPLQGQALAAATNQGEIPPEIALAAQGAGPLAPQATEQVAESAGVNQGTGAGGPVVVPK